jgi:hypothetical protein
MTITRFTKSKLSVVYCLKYNQSIMGGKLAIIYYGWQVISTVNEV